MSTPFTTTRAARTVLTATAAVALLGLAVPAAQASGGGDDVVRRGDCAGATHWKVKVGREDGSLEVEGEIDSNHAGQTWRWRLLHDGATAAKGSRTTKAPSGSFTVRRTVANHAGTDTIRLRARNTVSDELCVGTVRF